MCRSCVSKSYIPNVDARLHNPNPASSDLVSIQNHWQTRAKLTGLEIPTSSIYV